jgi:hypothetical protein
MKIIKKLMTKNRDIRKKQNDQAYILNQKAQLKIWEEKAKKEKAKEKYNNNYLYSRMKDIDLEEQRRELNKQRNKDRFLKQETRKEKEE